MKIRFSVLQLLSIMIAALVFSTSFPSPSMAQYDSVEAAKTDAKADAKADTNKFFWVATGCGASLLTLGIAGLMLNKYISQTGSASYRRIDQPDVKRAVDRYDDLAVVVALVPYSVASSAVWGASKSYKLSPPTARLIGKPPQYIDVYTTTYKKQKEDTQSTWGLVGLAVGSVAGLVYLLSILD